MFTSTLIFFLIGLFFLATIIGYGYLFERIVCTDAKFKLHELGFFGFIFIFLISNTIHFFSPLNPYISIGFIFIGTVSFFLMIRLKEENLNKFFFFSLILFSLLSLTINHHDDSYWYQLPYINYFQNYKTIIGVNNLNFFFYGHAIYEVMAIFNISFLPNSILFIIPCSIIFFIFFFILEELRQNKFKEGLVFLVFLGFLIIFRYTRSKEYGADLVTMCYMFLVFYYFIKEVFHKGEGNIFKIYIFFIFSIFSKPYSIFLIFFPIYIFLTKYRETFSLLKNKKVLVFLIMFLIIPITKNYLQTSCLYYPIKSTCFSSNDWYIGDNILIKQAQGGSAIAKGYKNYIFEKKNASIEPIIFLKENKFSYLKYLVQDKDFERLLIALSVFIISFFVFFRRDQKELNNHDKKKLITLTLSLLSFLFWFLTLPQTRYGGNIVILIFSGSIFLTFFYNWNLNFSKVAKSFLILSLIFLVTKNFKRIWNEVGYANNSKINFPLKELNSFSANEKILDKEKFLISNDKLFCVNARILCTTRSNFYAISKINIVNGYLKIVPDKNKMLKAFEDITTNHRELWINYK